LTLGAAARNIRPLSLRCFLLGIMLIYLFSIKLPFVSGCIKLGVRDPLKNLLLLCSGGHARLQSTAILMRYRGTHVGSLVGFMSISRAQLREATS
jgi:hypothetical protein